jgi:hypothetical protein
MRWKISIEGSDEITQGHRLEFEIAKSLDDLAAGSLGLSVDDGKTILASLQRYFIEQQCALYVLFRRHCQGCGGTRPIKDYSPERSRQFTALSPWRALGYTPAAAACPVLISQSLQCQSSALTVQL